jgi:monofunctional biosynthetic peptidoglycan transglycosylase
MNSYAAKGQALGRQKSALLRSLFKLLLLLLVAVLSLQLYFVVRIALMAVLAPESTAFQRSEIFRVVNTSGALQWRQSWLPYAQMSANLKRAVIASEDAGFTEHDGLDLEALEKAWGKNNVAEQRAQKLAARLAAEEAKRQKGTKTGSAPTAPKAVVKAAKIVGGSTITQQLAKNLFLSGERTLFRKGEELLLTLMLEGMLSKQRILEIYLNNVEWGEGVFGAEAAAQHYFRKPAARLSPYEAARLAVMLPRPRYFETRPNSEYLDSRANTIVARMAGVVVP